MTSYASKPLQIYPVTLKTLKAIHQVEDSYIIYSKPSDTVEIVARLVLETRTPSKIDLIVQDHTGSATIIFYKKPSEESEPRSMRHFTFEPNSYVKIFAQLKKVQGELALIGQSIENIRTRSDVNEFLTRILVSAMKSDSKHDSITMEIMKAIQSLDPSNSSKGVTISQIHSALSFKYSSKHLEDVCTKLQSENILSIGQNWNHYRVNN